MKLQEFTERLGLTVALKIKRFLRRLRRPFIKTKLDFSASLYQNENEAVPTASASGDLDHDFKIADIAAAFALLFAFCGLLKAITRIFR